MHRDICATNRESIVRWLDQAVDDLQHMRSLIAAGSSEADETLLAMFNQARDARADWATTERRSGDLLQSTEDELTKISVSDQMNQMFFGSVFRRKPRVGAEPRNGREKAGRPDRR
jgi:prephenate dehydrogenase